MTHSELKRQAICWLIGNGCWLVAEELAWTDISDAVGINYRNDRYMVEAKVSRGDLLSKKQREVYERSLLGASIYDFHYIIVPPDFRIKDSDYPRWGFIQNSKVVRRTKRIEKNGQRLGVTLERLIEMIARRNTNVLYRDILFPKPLEIPL